jgi:protein TonB
LAVACFAVLCVLHGAFFSLAAVCAGMETVPAKREISPLVIEFEFPAEKEEPAPVKAEPAAPPVAPRPAPAKPAVEPALLAEAVEAPEAVEPAAAESVALEESSADGGQEAGPEIAVPAFDTPVAAAAVPARRVMSESDYIALIMRRLEEKKVYPLAMRKRGIAGNMPVRFTIGADGALVRVTAEDSRAHPFLAQAALETVRSASPFPVMEGRNGDFSLQVTIRYELE